MKWVGYRESIYEINKRMQEKDKATYREIDDLRTQLTAAQERVRELEYGKALLTKWCAGAEVEIDRLREGLERIEGGGLMTLQMARAIARNALEVE